MKRSVGPDGPFQNHLNTNHLSPPSVHLLASAPELCLDPATARPDPTVAGPDLAATVGAAPRTEHGGGGGEATQALPAAAEPAWGAGRGTGATGPWCSP